MLSLKKTDSQNPDFVELVKQLDAYLAITDGDEHGFYSQFNKIENIKHVVVAYQSGKAVGCGAIKPFSHEEMEIKRMFTLPESRGKGVASQILSVLEKWSAELGYQKCILETGVRQKEAIIAYQKNGYQPIPNYGQYMGVENSKCFMKHL